MPVSSPTASSAPPRSTSPSPASPARTARPPARGCWRRRCSAAGVRRPTSARSGSECRRGLAPLRHTTADAVTVQRQLAALLRRGRRLRRHGGLLARARPAARQRRALQHRSLHQSHPRSSRLSRHHAGVRRGQGAPVRRARRWRGASSTSTMPSARQLAAAPRRGTAGRDHARRAGRARCPAGRSSCAPRRCGPSRRGLR